MLWWNKHEGWRGREVRWAAVEREEQDRSCGAGDGDFPELRPWRPQLRHGRGSSGGASGSEGSARNPSPASSRSDYTAAPGDSEATDNDEPAVADDDQPAVADAEDEANPPDQATGWRKKEKTTTPAAVAGEPQRALRNSALTEREDVGNIGWFFGNWGRRTKQMGGDVQQNIDNQIKKNHAKSWVCASANAQHRTS